MNTSDAKIVEEGRSNFNPNVPPVNPNYYQQNSNYIPSAPPSAPPSEVPSEMPSPNVHYYQTFQISKKRYFIKSTEPNRHFPVNAAFFLLGFVFPLLWIVGCFWKRNDKYEIFWRKLNVFMTWLFFIGIILWTIFLSILLKEEYDHGGIPNGHNGDLPKIPNTALQ